MLKHALLLLLINFLTTSIRAQFTGCDYFQNVVVGQTYDIFSPGYGSYYQPGINCRWRALGPVNSKLTLNCIDVNLPQNNCNDRLEISWSGMNNPNPNWYCSSQTFSSTTSDNSIEIDCRTSENGSLTALQNELCLTLGLTGILRIRCLRNFRIFCTKCLLIHKSQPSGYISGKFRCQLTVQSVTSTPNQCDCGRRRQSRIVNGDVTGVNEFTMMAGLVDTRDRNVYCGGTIISNNHVLTSAHCLTNRVATALSLLIGDHDYTTTSDTPYAVFYPVSSIIIHPLFDRNTNLNDIAIIVSAASITYNVAVGPACLPFAYETVPFTDSVVEAVGWGTIFFGGEISTKLRKVSLNVIDNAACSGYYSNIASTQMCVKTPAKDTCQRDSGGPIFGNLNGRVFLLGIISYGQGCATSYPSVNTRVTSYLRWIQANTYGATYCQ